MMLSLKPKLRGGGREGGDNVTHNCELVWHCTQQYIYQSHLSSLLPQPVQSWEVGGIR